MSNLNRRTMLKCSHNVEGYTKDSPVKITRGSWKGCKGKISGSTIDGVYFIWREESNRDTEDTPCPVGPFLHNELELLN